MGAIEREARLVVVGEGRGALFEELAAARTLAGLTVGPFEERRLADEYFDLPDGVLAARDCALRLRSQVTGDASDLRLTLKGPASERTASAVAREELEESWSPAFFERVRERLCELGVALPAGSGDDPRECLLGCGLASVQRRVTTRRASELSSPTGPVAELVLDRVEYGAGGLTVLHREVEIEALGGLGVEELEGLATRLSAEHPGRLRPWPWSKTRLGRALEELQAAGELGPLSQAGELEDGAYDRVGARLSRQEAARSTQSG